MFAVIQFVSNSDLYGDLSYLDKVKLAPTREKAIEVMQSMAYGFIIDDLFDGDKGWAKSENVTDFASAIEYIDKGCKRNDVGYVAINASWHNNPFEVIFTFEEVEDCSTLSIVLI